MLELELGFEGRNRREVAEVLSGRRHTRAQKEKRAGSLRPFPYVSRMKQFGLGAEPPAQRLKTNQSTAEQHERHTTVGNTNELLRRGR